MNSMTGYGSARGAGELGGYRGCCSIHQQQSVRNQHSNSLSLFLFRNPPSHSFKKNIFAGAISNDPSSKIRCPGAGLNPPVELSSSPKVEGALSKNGSVFKNEKQLRLNGFGFLKRCAGAKRAFFPRSSRCSPPAFQSF